MFKKVKTDPKLIAEFLTRGVENIYPSREALEKVLRSGKRLRIYNGIDPTGPALHLGHAVVLRKLKQLQDLGHEVIMLIGDFTGMIGDPTDKLAARQQLTRKQVLTNCRNYKKQAGKILNFHGLNAVKIKFNSTWNDKLKFAEVLKLASEFTAQQMLDREMFKKRLAEGKDLSLQELLYPLIQAYDSVAMEVDLEIGGNDQMFNMLCGRTLLKRLKNKEKFVLTAKLLADPTGKKMGKTEGNMITLADNAETMYGKVMSWPDTLILPGFEILTTVAMPQAAEISAAPRDFKMKLAREIVKLYHGGRVAADAEESFIKTFRDHEAPTDAPKVYLKKSETEINVVDLFMKAGLVTSKNEARRLIEQGGLSIDGAIIDSPEFEVTVQAGSMLKKGKRHFAQVEVK
ncbi:MAG: tyrosine--tRNA ligase [Patescibacteria group bacterium]|jgi:tyrosyl-tRNA synthetase